MNEEGLEIEEEGFIERKPPKSEKEEESVTPVDAAS